MDRIEVPTPADVAGLSGADLDRALAEVESARRRLEAAYLAVLDRSDATKRYADDGHASVRGWASALTDTAPAETQRRLQSMRALRELPSVAGALAAGTIGVDHVRDIARVHANPRVRELVVDGDDLLVRHAGRGIARLGEVLQRWVQFGDPDGSERRHDVAHRDRDAMLFERDGVVFLHAHCGTAQGASLLEIFARQCDAEFLSDWEAAKAEHGDDAHPGVLERTDGQRRMDALARLLERAVAAPPGSRPPEPVVDYVITKAELEAALVEMQTGTTPAAATIDDIDAKRCETSTGLATSVRDVVVAALVGTIRRVVIDESGRVIDLGRRRRFTGASRDAVLLGDGRRCMWPGCGRDTHRNQIDHTHEHARGGLTRPNNGGPACGRHNRIKTHGFTVHRDADGVWHVHRPDGTEITRPAAA
ncbi:MAG: DUF222 domain-containing protein [Ilumatobacteraceae bacterium]